ncbi:MAG: glutamine--fructose-6-phosphate transaminase (isomerizing) [Candidatus Nealsonbacteria bacterium]|nr:glutamine--fructose-6-phosphate transaminase (isomerizing) [Candidatus Nealsonbacteria bacterium]
MCGIVGYIGPKRALPIVIDGLKRLEYRGYDSIGVLAYDQEKKEIYLEKQPGRVQEFIKTAQLDKKGGLAIGHTRWATHGLVTRENSHPHGDCQKKIFVVHNGIIENFQELKDALLKKGHVFVSQTDTEVVPHLIEERQKQGLPYREAIMQTLKDVRGSFALLIFNKEEPDLLVGTRFSSPLILGTNDQEFIFASDPTPIGLVTKNVLYLNDGDVAFVSEKGYELKSFLSEKVEAKRGVIDFTAGEADKGNFPDFMLKEIFEEPLALENTLRGRLLINEGKAKLGGLEPLEPRLREVNRVILVACGTASYAALAAEYFFEEYAEIPTEVDLGSEFRYRKPIIDNQTLFVAISQSGETADTLAAIKEAKTKGALTLGIVNVVGSTIARQVGAGIYSHAGPELAVASTKAFTTQIADLVLLMLFLARERKMSLVAGQEIMNELRKLPEKMRSVLLQADKIKALAEKYSVYKNFFYLGRKYGFPMALEGSLKLKECAYIHSEAYPSGEMKHGPIAIVDEDFPSIVLAPQDSVYEKVVSNIQEIKARKGKVIAVTTAGNQDLEKLVDDVIYIPQTLELLTPLLAIVPLHLFAYYLAKKLGRDVDRPRNLAKSVTVE